MAVSISGIDISKWQGNVDIKKVKKEKSFVICKASEGVGYTDPKFYANRKKLRENSMARGYYHFARPDLGNTGASEADWFLKVVGELQKGEVLVLDAENSKTKYSNWVNWSYDFLKRIESKIGYKPMIYMNLNFNNIYNWSKVVKNDNGLWLALWDNKPAYKPKTDWPFIAIKQYGTVKVSGISGDVDGDIFYGSIETFKKYGYNPPVPPVEPPEAPDCTKYQERIKELKKEIELLNDDKERLGIEIEGLEDKVKMLGLLIRDYQIAEKKLREYS